MMSAMVVLFALMFLTEMQYTNKLLMYISGLGVGAVAAGIGYLVAE